MENSNNIFYMEDIIKKSKHPLTAKSYIEYVMNTYKLSLKTIATYAGYRDRDNGDKNFKVFLEIVSVCDYNSLIFQVPKRRLQLRINVMNYLKRQGINNG